MECEYYLRVNFICDNTIKKVLVFHVLDDSVKIRVKTEETHIFYTYSGAAEPGRPGRPWPTQYFKIY